jgi:tetratricopeptide (TPR) repeat protein
LVTPNRFTVTGLLIVFLGLTLVAQDRVPATSSLAPRTTVYLIEMTQNEPVTWFAELSKFTTSFLQLRLAKVNTVNVMRQPALPGCGAVASRSEQAKGKLQTAIPADDSSPFYVVRGSIEVRQGGSASPAAQQNPITAEVVLNYELLKFVGCQSSPVLHRFDTFSNQDILETLGVEANLLAARLDTELTRRVLVDVQLPESEPDGTEQKALSNGMVDAIIGRLAFSNSFQTRDLRTTKPDTPPDYTVESELKFKRTFNPLQAFSLTGVEATLYVVVHDPSSPLGAHRYLITPTAVKSPLSDHDAFYASIAQAVIQGLEKVRFAREANLTGELSALESDALLAKAKEFLCIGTEDVCSPRADAALSVLSELTQRPEQGKDFEVLSLLGRAYFQAGRYLQAGQTYDKALSLGQTKTPEENLNLLNQAGDAWYKAEGYDQAAAHYARSLEVSERNASSLPDNLRIQAGVRIQRARSLRFEGKRLDAIDSLLSTLKILPDASPVNAELQDLIATLPSGEINNAVSRLEAAGDSRISPSLFAAYVQLAVRDQQNFNFDDMDGDLHKAEALPPETATMPIRVQSIRLRAAWFAIAKGDYTMAVQSTQKLIALQDSPQAQYDLARYTFQLASDSKSDTNASRRSYQRVIELASPLVKQRFLDSDDLLLLANHELNADHDTRTLMDTIVAQNPTDVRASTTEMYVCTEYLKDFECSLKTAQVLEKIQSARADSSLVLEIAEVYVLNHKYEEAQQRIQTVMADPALEPGLHVVADFYLAWALLAESRVDEARKASVQWKSELTGLRDHDLEVSWVFGGAETALAGESFFSAEKKQLFLQMIAAMTDPKKTLPEILF